MTPEEALDVLYGNEARDLSGDGYQTALKKLRRKSPKQANQVERALRRTLDTVLPRRAIKWHETSRGTTYRLALLPKNSVFQMDVENIREFFGLPTTGLSPDRNERIREVFQDSDEDDRDIGTESSPVTGSAFQSKHMRSQSTQPSDDPRVSTIDATPRNPDRAEETDYLEDLIASGAVGRDCRGIRDVGTGWIRAHRRAAGGQPPDSLSNDLSTDLKESAVAAAQINLDNVEELTWLGYSGLSTECQINPTPLSSLHLAVGALLLRHHLPHHLCGKMEVFMVTGDLTVLSGLSSLDVSVLMGNGQGVGGTGRATKVVVDGIDEFTTSEDWSRVYKDFIRPLLDMKNEERGTQPHGRLAPELERLRKGLRLYREWLNTDDITKALDRLALKGLYVELDMETARRVVKDLDDLLRPADLE